VNERALAFQAVAHALNLKQRCLPFQTRTLIRQHFATIAGLNRELAELDESVADIVLLIEPRARWLTKIPQVNEDVMRRIDVAIREIRIGRATGISPLLP
jgi:hypothetical protein